MPKRLLLIFMCGLLVGGLLLATPRPTFAADPTTAEQTEDQISVAGPGSVIIMVGLAAIALVGGAYAARRPTNNTPDQAP